MKIRLISLMVAAALAASANASPETEAAESARRAELEKARAELNQAARRVAELSREAHESRTIKIKELRSDGSRARLGIVMSPDAGSPGVRIAAVTPGGPAAKAGLRPSPGTRARVMVVDDDRLVVGMEKSALGVRQGPQAEEAHDG